MDENKRHVAIKKIFTYHPNIDMSPLFQFVDTEEDDDNLKGLPYVIVWFERAMEAIFNKDKNKPLHKRFSIDVDQRKLSAIYQFARAMPLLIADQCSSLGDSSFIDKVSHRPPLDISDFGFTPPSPKVIHKSRPRNFIGQNRKRSLT